METKELEREIVRRAETILPIYENEGADAAFKQWQEIDQLTTGKRKMLSAEILDLVLQLEFLLEGHPESDLSDLNHALYVAKVTTKKERR
jgi:hypothetical protein